MADNTVLPGTGQSVRTIDKGGHEAQVMVIDLGGSGAESLLTTSMPIQDGGNSITVDGTLAVTNAGITTIAGAVAGTEMQVDVLSLSSLIAGEAHIGAAGGNTISITVTPTLSSTDAYIAGDYVGSSSDAMTFTNAARVAGGTGVIQSAVMIDYASTDCVGELWMFDQAPTPPANSAAWTISDADSLKCIGVIEFNRYYASALNSVSNAHNLGIAFTCAGGSRNIYGCFVTRGAPVYENGDISFRLTIIQD